MQEKRINLSVDHGGPGFITDGVTISHNPERFIFDFVQTMPKFDKIGDKMSQSVSIMHNTVVMNPAMAKSILNILKDNMEKYEKVFGDIKLPKREQIVERDADYSESESTKYIG